MNNTRVPFTLKKEIIDCYEAAPDRPSPEILAALNAPHRIQERGFVVNAEHLLGVIIDSYKIGPRTRFILYDYDMGEVACDDVYDDLYQAQEDVKDYPNTLICRFEVPQ